MSNEAEIRTTLTIVKGNLEYLNRPSTFSADIATANGPSPGVVSVGTGATGTQIVLSALSTPALTRIMNIDDTNFVEMGTWDGVTFQPLLELLPGESYIIRLSRNVQDSGDQLRAKADTAAVNLLVEAFDA